MYEPIPDGIGAREVVEGLLHNVCFPEREPIPLIPYISGGGMAGASVVGIVEKLQELGAEHGKLGLNGGWQGMVLASTGAAVGAFTATGQAHLAARAYQQLCTKRSFVRFNRKGVIRVKALIREMRQGPYALDVAALRAYRFPIYVIISTPEGVPTYVDLRTAADPIAVIHASMALPGWLCGEEVRVEGRLYIDGDIVEKLPLPFVRQKFGSRARIVFFPNRNLPLPRSLPSRPLRFKERMIEFAGWFLEMALWNFSLLFHPRSLRRRAKQGRHRLQVRMEQLFYDEREEHSFSILPTPRKGCRIGPFTTNPRRVRLAVRGGRSAISHIWRDYRRALVDGECLPSESRVNEIWELMQLRRLLRSLEKQGPLA